MQRTLLYVTYKFPPLLAVESLRAKRFVRHLPEFGWRAVVVTVAPRPDQRLDHSLQPGETGALAVHRVTPVMQSLLNVRDTLRAEGGISRRFSTLLGAPYRFFSTGPTVTASVFLRAQRAVRHYRPELVLGSFGPPAALWVANFLRRAEGVPYVAEFRDLWVGNEYSNRLKGTYSSRGKYSGLLSGLKQKRQRVRRQVEQERKLVDDSAGLLVVGEQMAETYTSRYPHFADRILELSHGYDEADFPDTPSALAAQARRPRPDDPLLICHLGTLHRFRKTDTLFAALRQAVQRNPLFPRRLTFVFVGNVDPATAAEIRGDPVLSQTIRLLGSVSHQQALRLALDSDALLLLTGPLVWEQTGKLSEYVATGRPIIAISHPDSSASRMVRRTGAGTVIAHGEVDRLTETLLSLTADATRLHSLWSPNAAEIDSLSARNVTRRLAAFLDECLAQQQPAPAEESV